MTVKRLSGALSTLMAIVLSAVPISAQSQQSNQDFIGQARGAYYNLTKHGFNGFDAAVEPKWEVILGPTATTENLKVFRAVRFSLTVDPKGAVKVNHVVISSDRIRLEPYIKQIQYNIQRLVAGVLGTWATFMVNSPFPEDDQQSKVEDLSTGYQLFYTRQSSDASLTLTRDLLITEWRLTDATAKRTIKPLFQKTSDGLLLRSYQTIFEPLGAGRKTTLEINIEYQAVSGMKLPRKIQFKGMHGSEPVEAELTFNQCVLRAAHDNQK